jgi:ABC-type nitrate/sulfonate/bicarbonate transport system substrate-binding protein
MERKMRNSHHWVARALALACCMAASVAGAADDSTLHIAYPTGMNGEIAVVMEKAKIVEALHLDATFTSFQYGPPMMEALASGAVNAVITSLMPITSYASRIPNDIKVVGMLGQSIDALMVGGDSQIQSPKQLVGHTIGVSFGSDSYLDLVTWLRDAHLADQVTLANVAPSDLVAALANKSVDAVVVRQPQVLRLETETHARVLKSWPFHFVTIMKARFVAEHPEVVQRYVEAIKQTILFISQNQALSARWFADYLRTDPAVVAAASADDPTYHVSSLDQIDVSVAPADRAIMKQWFEKALAEKMIRHPVDADSLFR